MREEDMLFPTSNRPTIEKLLKKVESNMKYIIIIRDQCFIHLTYAYFRVS